MQKITPQDPAAQSLDLQADNIAKLKALFPELLTEVVRGGKTEASINIDVLKALVGDATATDADEKYGLNWHGKRRARQLALTPSTGTLRPCKADSVDWDSTQNLMIEGDNLEVLKLLQKSYAGKVKLIYIDPPYNTGKDFVYPDNFQDNIKNYLELTGQVEGGQKLTSNPEASGRFHTDWLNMMYPRLKLARNLLKDDGVFAVTIDDGEVGNLRSILDEIFGEENFVANIVWQKKYGAANDAKYLSDMHDHILFYCKNKELWRPNLFSRPDELNAKYTNPDNDPRGAWYPTNLSVKTYSASNDYVIKSPAGLDFSPPPSRAWVVSKNKFSEMLADNRITFGRDGLSRPYSKTFLSEVQQGIVPTTIWLHEDAGHNIEGKSLIRDLFGESADVFDTPKPIRLIQRLIDMSENSSHDDIFLDFFAGSGTTGHAVLAQNSKDNGNRRYILVQIPEPLERIDYKFLSKITEERLRRAGAKVKADNPLFAGDVGFRVFKLDTSNIRAWQPTGNIEEDLLSNQNHLIEGRTSDDVLYELLLKLGLDLCVPIELQAIAGKTCHSIGGGVLMACLAESITVQDAEPLALGLAAWVKALAPAVHSATGVTAVFRDSAFENDVAKSNLAAILAQHGVAQVRSL
jgi:adenine-specific DNA-methyltransferase